MATKVKLIDNTISPTLAGGTFTGHIDLGDNNKIRLGDSDDLQIYHDGSHSRLVDSGTGNFIIQAAQFRVNTSNDAEAMIKADVDGAVTLYYDNSPKIATSSTGATVTGNLAVTGDLDITGNVNSASVTDLDVTDKTITLGAGQTEGLSGGSGIVIDGSGASILWDETNTEWDFNNNINVAGNIKIETTGNPIITNKTTGAGNNPVFRLQADTNYWDLQSTFSNTDDELFFMYNGSTKMAIDNSGRVGIGISSPGYPLEISSTSTVSLAWQRTGSGVTAKKWGFDSDNAATYLLNITDNTRPITILNSGRIGFGPLTPSGSLHVTTKDNSGSDVFIVAQNTTNNRISGYKILDESGSIQGLWRYDNGGNVASLSIGTDAAPTTITLAESSTGISFTSTATSFNSGKVGTIRGEVTGTGHGNLAFDTFQGGSGGGERMVITSAGIVDIGKSAFSSYPTGSKLNVYGDGEVFRLDGTGATSRTFRFRNVSTTAPGIITADGSLEIGTEDANTSIGLMSIRDIIYKTTKTNSTAGHHKFYSHNTEIVRIDGQHNRVGIGTTAPNAPLTIWTASAASSQSGLRLNNPGGFASSGAGCEIIFSQDRSTSEDYRMAAISSGQQYSGSSSGADLKFWTRHSSSITNKMTLGAAGDLTVDGPVSIKDNNLTIDSDYGHWSGRHQTLVCHNVITASNVWTDVAFVSYSPSLTIQGTSQRDNNGSYGMASYFGTIFGGYGSVTVTATTNIASSMNGGGFGQLEYRYLNGGAASGSYRLQVRQAITSGTMYITTTLNGQAYNQITED